MHHQPTTRRRIVIVDSHEDTRDMYATYLRDRGFELFTCGDGRSALAMAVRIAPTAIVTAARLSGGIDGLALAALLRRDARTADSSIIVLTATAFGRDRVRMDRCGCDAVLLLPCFPEVLELEIRRAVVSRAISRTVLTHESAAPPRLAGARRHEADKARSMPRGDHEQFLRKRTQRHEVRPPRT